MRQNLSSNSTMLVLHKKQRIGLRASQKRLDRRERLLTGLISVGIFFGGSILRVLHLPKL